MVDVPSARDFGFRLTLHEGAMRDVLTGPGVRRLLADESTRMADHVAGRVRATASAEDAENYVGALIVEATYSDDLGIEFDGPYALGSRPAAIVGVPAGRGPNPAAKPPLMVEAETHALSSVPGLIVGSTGEDIR